MWHQDIHLCRIYTFKTCTYASVYGCKLCRIDAVTLHNVGEDKEPPLAEHTRRLCHNLWPRVARMQNRVLLPPRFRVLALGFGVARMQNRVLSVHLSTSQQVSAGFGCLDWWDQGLVD